MGKRRTFFKERRVEIEKEGDRERDKKNGEDGEGERGRETDREERDIETD